MQHPDTRAGEYETLLCERPADSPGVLVVSLNRPQAANALNTQMARDLLDLFSGVLLDPGADRCIVLTGAGQRAFCAGGDLKERDGMSDEAWRKQHVLFEQAFHAILECPVPIIAAVNGAAYGGGCEFALSCDFIYAARSASFAQSETRLGIIPGGGGTQLLARAVGAARAKELIYSAVPFDASQAFEWGMVNKLCPDESLLAESLATARAIAANAPVAVRQAKLAITNGLEVDRRTGLVLEIAAYNQTVPTRDRREGIRAAIERRAPKFSGE
jgi:enoyl-CoA hydratase/carnithine racemase